jgi:hypothetical protein
MAAVLLARHAQWPHGCGVDELGTTPPSLGLQCWMLSRWVKVLVSEIPQGSSVMVSWNPDIMRVSCNTCSVTVSLNDVKLLI